MNIYGDRICRGVSQDLLNYVLKTGDNMSGDLAMGGNKVTDLADPANLQDAATKNYVDSRKPLITVWVEQYGSLVDGQYNFSFGNGSESAPNIGYTMMSSGRLIRMGLSASSGGATPGLAIVNIVISGVENTAYSVSKPNVLYSGTNTFGTPLELVEGNIINFRSAITNINTTVAVVSALIELDL